MLFSLETIGLLAIAIGFLYLYLTWNHNYWAKRGIKYDKPDLLFGSLKDSIFMKKNMGLLIRDIYNAFPNEKVIGYFNLRKPVLMVRDPEIAHRILTTDFYAFRNNDAEISEDVDPILGRNIFFQKDELWKKNRALITPAFTAGKIKAIFSQMKSVAEDLVAYLSKHPEELHVKHTLSRYTTEIAARCALGIDSNCFKDDKPEIHEMGKIVFEPDTLKGLKFLSFFIAPGIFKLLKLKLVPQKVIDFFDSILRDVIVYRQKENIQRNDLVQYFIDVKKKTIEVEKGNIKSDIVTKTYTDDDILSGCILFFIEAYETASALLSNTLFTLAKHRDVQEKLRAEIDEVLKKGELTFEVVNEMNYLHCVMLESFRYQPALTVSIKQCTENYEMDIGKSKPLKVEKGTTVVIPSIGIHNDPKYWEDADLYKPERFANKEELTLRAKGIYLPFGDGPRMCIGMRIASVMIKLALIHILSNFDVLPSSRTPEKIEPDPASFILAHKGGLYLKFAKRAKQ